MTSEGYIDVRLRVQDVQQFLAGVNEAAGGVEKLGAETVAANEKAKASGGGFGSFGGSVSTAKGRVGGLIGSVRELGSRLWGTAKYVVGFGAAFAGWQGIKSSLATTKDFIAQMRVMTGVMGMSNKEASTWAGIAQVRGVQTQALARGFGQMSKQEQQALQGSKQASDKFSQLGISMGDLKKHGNDMTWLLGRVSDGLNRIPAGTQRTAIASELLGRNWQKLGVLLSGGSREIDKNRRMMERYGVSMGDKGVKQLNKFHEASIEMNAAMLGIKLTVGAALMPILSHLMGWFTNLVAQMRANTGQGGKLRAMLSSVGGGFKEMLPGLKLTYELFGGLVSAIAKFLEKHPALAKMLGLLLGVALIANKLKILAVVMRIVTLAQWLWNASLLASPVTWIILGIVALVAIIVLAIKHWKDISRAVTDAWKAIKSAVVAGWKWVKQAFTDAFHFLIGFVKKYWPFILAPMTGGISIFVGLIIHHWDAIKKAFSDAFHWLINFVTKYWPLILAPMTFGMSLIVKLVISHWNDIIHFFESLPGKVAGIAKDIFKGLANGFIWAANTILHGFNWLLHNLGVPGFDVGPIHFGGLHPFSGVSIPDIPFLAAGGIITRSGQAVVGEEGPEILQLPRGARVMPLPPQPAAPRVRSVTALPLHDDTLARTFAPTVVAKVYLNKRQIGEAVGEVAQQQKARS